MLKDGAASDTSHRKAVDLFVCAQRLATVAYGHVLQHPGTVVVVRATETMQRPAIRAIYVRKALIDLPEVIPRNAGIGRLVSVHAGGIAPVDQASAQQHNST